MKFTVSEGKRRLRIVLSAIAIPITYIYLWSNERGINEEEAFLEFPFVSILSGAVTYASVTAVYWVTDWLIEGFGRDSKTIIEPSQRSLGSVKTGLTEATIQAREIRPVRLLAMEQSAKKKLHGKIREIMPFEKTGNPMLDKLAVAGNLHLDYFLSAHVAGLVQICMTKADRKFLAGTQNKGFISLILDGMVKTDTEQFRFMGEGENTPSSEKIREDAEEHLRKIFLGVQSYFSCERGETEGEPLDFLRLYLCAKGGLKSPVLKDMILEVSKELLSDISKQIENPAY